jgi:hypothetical protein
VENLKGSFEEHGRGWEDNIKADLQEIQWEGLDLIHTARDRGPLAGCYENRNEHLCSKKVETFLTSPGY